MASDELILGFDTSAAHCAAALLSGDRLLNARAEEMSRGQAERLMPMIEEMLGAEGATWRDLVRIGVGIGPGNFSGIRISVSAARGLALSLGIPAVGVSSFQAIRQQSGASAMAAVPAPRNQVYIQRGTELPMQMDRADAEKTGAVLALPPAPEQFVTAIARVARAAQDLDVAPAPLYVRPADAAPPREAPPRILDDAS